MLASVSKARYSSCACVVVGFTCVLFALIALFGCSSLPAGQASDSARGDKEASAQQDTAAQQGAAAQQGTAAQQEGEVLLTKLDLHTLTSEQADTMYVGAVDYAAAQAAGLTDGLEFSAEYLTVAAAYMAVFDAFLCDAADLGSYQDNLDGHPWHYPADGIDEALKQNGGFGRSNVFIRNTAYVERLNPDDLKLLRDSIEGDCVNLGEDVLEMVSKTYPTVLEVRDADGVAKSSVVYRDTVFDSEVASGDALVFIIAYEPEFDSSGALVEAEYAQDKAEIVQAASEVMQYEISKAIARDVAVFVESM